MVKSRLLMVSWEEQHASCVEEFILGFLPVTTLPVMLWCCVNMDMESHSQYKQDTLSVPVVLGAVLAVGYDSA